MVGCFTDIATEQFRAEEYGQTYDWFMAEIRGRLPDGTWVHGVEVFRRLYGSVGLAPLIWLSRLPIITSLLDGVYRVFARNRLRLTGRCTNEQCQVSAPPAATARDQGGDPHVP